MGRNPHKEKVMATIYSFPNEEKVMKRSIYAFRYTVRGKEKLSGITSGALMVNMAQYKHHDVRTDKLFEFRKIY